MKSETRMFFFLENAGELRFTHSRSNQIPTSFGSTLCRFGTSYLDDGVLKNITHIPPKKLQWRLLIVRTTR